MVEELKAFLKTRTKVNLVMCVLNVLAFIVMSALGNTENASFMLQHGAAYTPLILEGEWWRLFTAMFMHFGLIHLIYNMICLIFLGDMLETAVGPVRYLIIYLVGGLAGNLLSMGNDLRTNRFPISAGASGAIYAVIGAVLIITLLNRRTVSRNYVRRMIGMSVIMIAQSFMQPGTDAAAHVGGFIGGCLLGFVLYGIIFLKTTGTQRSGSGKFSNWGGKF